MTRIGPGKGSAVEGAENADSVIDRPAVDSEERRAKSPGSDYVIWSVPLVMNLGAGAMGAYASQGLAEIALLLLFLMGFLPLLLFIFISSVYFFIYRNMKLVIPLALASILPLFVMQEALRYADTLWLLYAFPSCYRAAHNGSADRYEYKWYGNGDILVRASQYRVIVAPPGADPLHTPPPASVIREGYKNTSFLQKMGPCWLMEDS